MDTYALREAVQVRLLDRTGLVGGVVAGRFAVEALLARGATGRVYLAEQIGLGRKVALKVLDQEAELASGLDYGERFEREAATLARLNHPHIVRIHDFGVWEDQAWLAMEYVDGVTLHQALAAEVFSPKRSLRLMRQVCSALVHAHSLGAVHRDLKPSNLLLQPGADGQERLKIVDFGLVKDLHELGEHTGVGTMMGSPRYMSPEQIREELVDGRADIYSLGVILWRCLAGDVPYDGVEPLAILYAHLHKDTPELEVEGLPPCLAWVVAHCLEKDREHRFVDVAQLDEALALCEDVLAGRLPWATVPELDGARKLQAPRRAFAARLPWRALGGAAALMAACALGFVLGQPAEQNPSGLVAPTGSVDAAEPAPQEPERGVPEMLEHTVEEELPALVSVSHSRRSSRRVKGLDKPLRAVVRADPGIIPHAVAVPKADLEPGSPWAGEASTKAVVSGTSTDPWAVEAE